MFNHILVVCVGNICRSPMGEALLAQTLKMQSQANLDVMSAGINALVGQSADPLAQQLMREQGIDISAHRARQLDRDLIYWADLILVMEKDQKNFLYSVEPSARGKVYRLGEWGEFDVPDPYRQSEAKFKMVFELIAVGVSDWAEKIKGAL